MSTATNHGKDAMTTLIGIAGSLRKGSYNTMLLRAAAELASGDARIEIASIRGIPLYDGDVEAESGVPEPARALKERIAAADGLLLVTPEYNHSIPGVFKNALDWLTRPTADIARVFHGRPVAVTGATPGRGGTLLAQTAWLPVFATLRMRPWFGARLLVSEAHKIFDAEGRLVDEKIRTQLRDFVGGFAEFIARSRSR